MPSLEKDDCIFLNREHIIPITIIENANDKTVFTSLKNKLTTALNTFETDKFPSPVLI